VTDAPRSIVFQARGVLAARAQWSAGGAVHVRDGRVVELASDAQRLRRHLAAGDATWIELPELVLTPGLVNAHAHLELTALGGRTPRAAPISAWIGALLRARAELDDAAWEASWTRGAARALATGTTWVGDIDSSGAWRRAAGGAAPRLRVYRELLDAQQPARGAAASASLARPDPPAGDCAAALSPHAPHTVSEALLAAIGRAAQERGACVGVHWAETAEEVEWLARGTGAFAALLGASSGSSGLARLAAHGLLGPRTALYHGNHPEPGDPERVARAGASLVHCPGTHAFFARAPFDLARWRAAGVALALGTDSLASNDDLDLRLELARLRRSHPELDPAEAWDMATLHGARALGGGAADGTLLPGARADLVAWRLAARSPAAALDELTAGRPRPERIWIGGVEREAGPADPMW